MKKIKIDWELIFTCLWVIFLITIFYLAFPIVTLITIGILVILSLIGYYGILKPADKDLRRLEELRTKEDRTPEEEKEYCDKYIYWDSIHFL